METWEIEPSERLRLLESVKYGSERVLESIMRYEDELSADYKGGIGAQVAERRGPVMEQVVDEHWLW